jgi:hypothetical protein
MTFLKEFDLDTITNTCGKIYKTNMPCIELICGTDLMTQPSLRSIQSMDYSATRKIKACNSR